MMRFLFLHHLFTFIHYILITQICLISKQLCAGHIIIFGIQTLEIRTQKKYVINIVE